MTQVLSNTDILEYESIVRAAANKVLSSWYLSPLSIERDDIYQIGWVALIGCLKCFDKTRGIKFETYCSVAIKHAINKELQKLTRRRMCGTMVEISDENIDNTSEREMDLFISWIEKHMYFNTFECTVFWMRFLDNESFTTIGKKTGVCRETVRNMYNSLVNRVKELVDNEQSEV